VQGRKTESSRRNIEEIYRRDIKEKRENRRDKTEEIDNKE
jgi:hypothetical protein